MTREEFEKSIGWPWKDDGTGHLIDRLGYPVESQRVNHPAIFSAMRYYLNHFDEARKEEEK